MNRLPAWAWNLLAIFCAAFAWVVAMAPAKDMSQVVMLRLSVALLGYVAVAAGSRGRFLHAALHVGNHIIKNRHRYLTGIIVIAIVLGGVRCIALPMVWQLQHYAKISTVHSTLRRAGGGLFQYAREHDQKLPPNITAQTIGGYLAPYRPEMSLIDPISKKPFIWRHSLSGINIKKIKHPEKVIVAYSLPQDDRQCRAILFLSGSSIQRRDEQFWELMREQRALLQEKAKPLTQRSSLHHD